MDKRRFKIIKGGLGSPSIKSKREFARAYVTNTRLMGVLVMYIKWKISDDKNSNYLHQFFYIETTEAGIESYRGIYGNDESAIIEMEQSLIGGLGSDKVSVNEKEVRILIQQYADLTEELGQVLPSGRDEYDFLLTEKVEATDIEKKALFRKICVSIENDEQLINYFLMRYFAVDFPAAEYLSIDGIDKDMAPNSKTMTLSLNRIEHNIDLDGNTFYMNESLVEDMSQYSIIVSEIRVENRLISSFKVTSAFKISAAEAAMKLERPEFITVYEIMGNIDKLKPTLDELYPAALKKDTSAGRVYLNFKNDNDHLKETLYRLNDDVKGIIYVTNEAQLILVAYNLKDIQKLENEVQYSVFGNMVLAIAKYEFKESVFYDFMQNEIGDFLHYMEFISDYDPDDD